MVDNLILNDSCFSQLLALFLVLTDETLDEDILVTNAPTLVYNNGHKHEHHHDEGGGKGNCEDKCYIHTLCDLISTAKLQRLRKTTVPW